MMAKITALPYRKPVFRGAAARRLQQGVPGAAVQEGGVRQRLGTQQIDHRRRRLLVSPGARPRVRVPRDGSRGSGTAADDLAWGVRPPVGRRRRRCHATCHRRSLTIVMCAPRRFASGCEGFDLQQSTPGRPARALAEDQRGQPWNFAVACKAQASPLQWMRWRERYGI